LTEATTAATPITQLRRWMSGRSIGAAYITGPVSIAYLTGVQARPMERLMALVVRPEAATLIVPALEQENASGHARDAEVVAWRDGEDPYALVASALAGLGEVAVEKEHLTLHAAEVMTTRTGASELVDVGAEIRRLRLTKHPEEIERLVRAAAITDAAGDEVFGKMRPGQTEQEVALLLQAAISARGGTLAFPSLVQSGPHSALPHAEPGSRNLRHGDFVLLDFGAAVEGYQADTTRMAVVGEPGPRHKSIHGIVLDAHDAAIVAIRAGVTAGQVDAAARRVIEAGGYGEHFLHRTGHGLGLETHEGPSLDPGSQTVLEPGMVVTVEPGVYIPGWGGVRIEDDVVVEEGGCRVLTASDTALRVIH